MASITFSVTETVSPRLRMVEDQIKPQRLAMVAGRAIAGKVREHLFTLDRSRANRLGGTRTHFYGQAARSVQQPRPVGGGAVVSINHVGIRQRLEGGVIRPVRSRWLTIPAVSEAHGKRAREFRNLEFTITDHGPALVETQASLVKFGKKGAKSLGEVGGRVVYWLRKKVKQRPDPSVLPSRSEMQSAAMIATSTFIERATAKGQAS